MVICWLSKNLHFSVNSVWNICITTKMGKSCTILKHILMMELKVNDGVYLLLIPHDLY